MIWNQHLFTSLSAFYCFSGSLSKAIKTSYLLQENKGLFLEVDTPQITSCFARVEERVSHRCFYGAFLFHLELGLLKMLMLALDDAQAMGGSEPGSGHFLASLARAQIVNVWLVR